MRILAITVKHVGVGLVAHTAAVLAAAGTMSAILLAANRISETGPLPLPRILTQWVMASVGIVIFVWLFTIALPLLLYPLALVISRRSDRATVLLAGGSLGFVLGLAIGLSSSSPTDYPMLTLAEYRAMTTEFVLFVVPASTIAGMVFGWVVATFDKRRSLPPANTSGFPSREG